MLNFVIGITAGILCAVSFLPQVIKSVKTKQTQDLSLAAFITLATGVSFWLVYGLRSDDVPIILANIATLILVLIVVAAKIKYG